MSMKELGMKELTHFSLMFHFQTPLKRQKSQVFWRIQGVKKWNIVLK